MVQSSSSSVGSPRRRGASRLGAEILDDDFLDMAVAPVEIGGSEERLEALLARLADADEDAGGEGDLPLARQPHRLEPELGDLVGRAVMNLAGRQEPLGRALQHQPHRGRDRAQQDYIGLRHHAGVDMRQKAGLAHNQRAHIGEVCERAGLTHGAKRLGGGGIAQLGLVAQGEERLVAAGCRAGAGDGKYVIGREIGRMTLARPLGEGAVMAHVAAELGERDEDLARIGDEPAVAFLGQRRRFRHERGERHRGQPRDQVRWVLPMLDHVSRTPALCRLPKDWPPRRPGVKASLRRLRRMPPQRPRQCTLEEKGLATSDRTATLVLLHRREPSN